MSSQAQRIVVLRGRGASYGQIADQLGISRNTVKSVCRRANAATPDAPATACEQCGQAFDDVVAGRRFCSARCRSRWWHTHPERLTRNAIYTFTCPACGKTFSAYGNKHRTYCCHACYIRHRFNTRGGRS